MSFTSRYHQQFLFPSGAVSTRQRELQGSGRVVDGRTFAANEESLRVDGVLRMYTDGSRLPSGHGGAGVAYYLEGKWHTFAKPLLLLSDDYTDGATGICVDNHDAEMLAIGEAFLEACVLAQRGVRFHRVLILTDSQTCIDRLGKDWRFGAHTTDQAIKCEDMVRERGIETEWKWIPGHREIVGNGLADEAARFGANRSRVDPASRQELVRDYTAGEMDAEELKHSKVAKALSKEEKETEGRELAAWGARRVARENEHSREIAEWKREVSLTPAELYAREMYRLTH
ncbi:hypothetical protein TI39_contig5823g00004 [Zymoseptoria brevis]|uniref:RNase H type-1 domain-containing protein n=1 Tax=Zymoseptoria brevis TaxID=1047168 RepID=A0A0F4G990_9PEZI|nr:hypothetical protein TI39_contig5823g00004 [Zymoseptoria brevis]